MAICCDPMKYFCTLHCSEHSGIQECPDVLVARHHARLGFIIHDSGTSKITIEFCPWCGANLAQQ